jgi:hypothetical protein
MKKLIVFVFVLSFLSVELTFAQSLNSSTYVNSQTMRTWNNSNSSFLDSVITNQINSRFFNQVLFSQMVFGQMMINNLKTKFGKERIAKRQASTKFTPTLKDSFIEKSAQDITNQDEKIKITSANKELLSTFQKAMVQNGLTQNDLADGRALAFVIAYQIVTNEFPGKPRLNALRLEWRKQMLASEAFQGTLDDEKQPEYEQIGIQSILAIYGNERAQDRNLTDSQRNSARQNAQNIAEKILSKIWGKPAGSIEMTASGFGNKTERLTRNGGGTVTFNRRRELAGLPVSLSEAEFYQKAVAKFDDEVENRGGNTNDIAFANVVAFDLAYYVVSDGKTLNSNHLKWLYKEISSDITTSKKATYFQGLTDNQRQIYYEQLGVLVIRLVVQFKKQTSSRQNKSNDTFSDLTNVIMSSGDAQNTRSEARMLMRNIISPRQLEDYELTSDGFKKIR